MFVKLLLLAFPLLAVAQRNCRDDPNFRWTNNWDGETFNLSCAFLTDERRRNNHCNRRVRGVLVRDMCRRSCNNCVGNSNPQPPSPRPPSPAGCNNHAVCNTYSNVQDCSRDRNGPWQRWQCCVCQNRPVGPQPNPPSNPVRPPSPAGCNNHAVCNRYSNVQDCSRDRNGPWQRWQCCVCQNRPFGPSNPGR